LPRLRPSGGPNLLAGEPVEPGPLPDDFDLLADQAVRSPSGVELSSTAGFGMEDEAEASLFEAAAQVQVGAHRQAGPFQ
jgi:hypothetical protein